MGKTNVPEGVKLAKEPIGQQEYVRLVNASRAIMKKPKHVNAKANTRCLVGFEAGSSG
jgi:hypothetical protein